MKITGSLKIINRYRPSGHTWAVWLAVLFTPFFSWSQNLENIGAAPAVSVQSGLQLQSELYGASGIDPRSNPFTYSLAGSVVFDVYGVQLPFHVIWSNHHRNFRQPFNQFGVSPAYKWATLHLGYNFMHFSPFTLADHRFLGAGVELNPGKLRFAALLGRFRKAIEEGATVSDQPGDYLFAPAQPSYRRTGYGFKIGYGTERNHFDLIFLKGKDHPASIQPPQFSFLQPVENAVAGFSWQFTFLKKLSWKTDLAASAYTRDVFSDTLDTGEYPLKNFLESILAPREGTQLLSAAETSLAFQDTRFGLRLSYRRVDPDFRTLGIYYLQTDVEQYLIAPNFSLAKNKVLFSGSAGIQHNNLLDQHKYTTRRFIGSANLSVNPSPAFGFTASYANYGITQSPLTKSLADTTQLEQISQSLSFMPRLVIAGDRMSHTFFVALNYNALSDRSATIVYDAEMKNRLASVTYQATWLRQGLSATLTLLRQHTSTSAGDLSTNGLTAGLTKALLKGKWSNSATVSLMKNQYGESSGGFTLIAFAQTRYRFSKHHALFLSFHFLKNDSDNPLSGKSFTETRARAGYGFSF